MFTNKFCEAFTDYITLSFINFLAGYDYVELVEESRHLTAFMTPHGLIRMMNLAKSITNLVVKFIKILLKILAPYLWDQAKSFLDYIGVK